MTTLTSLSRNMGLFKKVLMMQIFDDRNSATILIGCLGSERWVNILVQVGEDSKHTGFKFLIRTHSSIETSALNES